VSTTFDLEGLARRDPWFSEKEEKRKDLGVTGITRKLDREKRGNFWAGRFSGAGSKTREGNENKSGGSLGQKRRAGKTSSREKKKNTFLGKKCASVVGGGRLKKNTEEGDGEKGGEKKRRIEGREKNGRGGKNVTSPICEVNN